MKSGFAIINLILLGVGVLFIAACRQQDFIHSLIFFTGVALAACGAVNMVLTVRKGKKVDAEGKKPSMWSTAVSWISSSAALLLGGIMCFAPEHFRELICYVFAVTLLTGALYHAVMLWRGLRPVKFPMWTYLFPLAMLVISLVMLLVESLHSPTGQETTSLLTGIGLILFALTSFVEMLGVRNVNKKMAEARSESEERVDASHHIEDVTAEE